MNTSWQLVLPHGLWQRLKAHLFREDHDEHGAVIAAGVARTPRGARLLARDLFLARDGIEYIPGQRGYRMLTAEFVRDQVLYCRDEKLTYLAIHNHGGSDHVAFSPDDLTSHERGYPALLDVIRGQMVGAVVFADNAVAGDLWLPDGSRAALARARIVGTQIRDLYPAPPPKPRRRGSAYDRQARLFGDRGQAILQKQKVGIVGAGGAGSLLVEYLSRLGVGHVVVADPDRIDITNLPRVVGSTRCDALSWLTVEERPDWLRRFGARWSKHKIKIVRRMAKAANANIHIEAIAGDFLVEDVARRFVDCDFLFLAADTMQARLLFNAIVHQYLVPGIQVGAKVPVDKDTGEVLRVYSVVRPVTPDSGCLWCNGLISPDRLQEDALSEAERKAQRYVEEVDVIAPSVITMNAVAASFAANDYLFRITGLRNEDAAEDFVYIEPRQGGVRYDEPRRTEDCTECGHAPRSRFARGDSISLPTKQK